MSPETARDATGKGARHAGGLARYRRSLRSTSATWPSFARLRFRVPVELAQTLGWARRMHDDQVSSGVDRI